MGPGYTNRRPYFSIIRLYLIVRAMLLVCTPISSQEARYYKPVYD